MARVTAQAHRDAAATLRRQLAKYQEMELLVQIGEYKVGTDAEADAAIANIGRIRQFLQQPFTRVSRFDDSVNTLMGLFP